jgi:hypothetical protein
VKINVAGATLAFPDTNVGSSSSAQTASVTNLGDLPLVFALSPGYTANFSQPSGASGQCLIDTSVAAGMVCGVSVAFTPQTAGPLSASIVLTDNNLNVADATETVAVSGTGVATPDATATMVSVAPPGVTFGQPITITAVVTDAASGHTAIVPTGGVSFTDSVGSTVISLNGGNPVALNGAGDAILTGVLLNGVGLHTITANYLGANGVFLASSNTTTVAVSALSTTTTLTIMPGASIAAGTAATLTAAVTSGDAPVTPGTVVFCNATAARCSGEAIFGRAQLTSAGSAATEVTLGAGSYSIKAEFQATSTALASVSAAQPLTVTGDAGYVSYTAIADAGVAGDYTLTGTVTAFGRIVPSGTVSFLDATNSNAVVATAALNPSSLGFTFLSAPLSSPGSPLGVGSFPIATVLGDFNNDGKLDLAMVNYGSQTVSVALGNGDGTFQAPVTFAVGLAPTGIALGDFNHDGNLDLAVTNYEADDVSILLGDGNGSFAAQVTYATGHRPSGIVVADFNGDGNLDLAIADTFGTAVTVLLGHGDGTFLPDSPTSFTVGVNPIGIATADFNGDGYADLVVANANDGTVSLLLGRGNGIFQSQIVIPVSAANELAAVAVGDFNGDGVADLALPDNEGNQVFVLLGINGVSFEAPVAYNAGTSGTGEFGIALADFRGTGNLDIAVTNAGDSTVSLLRNAGNGSGAFLTEVSFPVGNEPWGAAAGDLNGDGLPDLVTANYGANTASVLLAAQTETAIATGVVVNGVGTHNVFASYPGDADRAPSRSSTVALTGSPLTVTATMLVAAPNPAVVGQSVTLTATITPPPTGSSLGSVNFYNGAALLGMGTVNASGIASFTTSSLPAGVLTLTAVYSGTVSFDASTSNAFLETVTTATTSTVLNGSPNPQYASQPVTLTATVRPAPTGNPAGIVSFYDGTNLLGTGTLTPSGVAMFTLSSLAVGVDGLSAVYPGNAGFAASTSSVNELINPAFAIVGPSAPVSVAPGGSVKIDLSVPPSGAAFNHAVVMSATGLPAGATAIFNPPTVTPGSAGAATVMTIQLAAATAGAPGSSAPTRSRILPVGPFTLAFVLFGIASVGRVGRKRLSKRIALVGLLAGLTLTTVVVTGCGGVSNTTHMPPENYTVTVTGTSGGFQAATTFTLTVE